MERSLVQLSLIIPTYRRSEVLGRCLESTQQQLLADFELLVVDNSPEGELRELVDEFNAGAHVRARYVHEPELGLHNARHAGARAASGEVLVFTDDDASFEPDWLAAYARCFDAHADMAAAGGPVRPVWDAPVPEWLPPLMAADPTMFPVLSLLDLSPTFRLTGDGIFFGVNMAIRRAVLFEVGGFNPDTFGDQWLGDGETGLNRKLWARGRRIGYIPDALVHHHVPAERMTVAYLRRRQANDGACDMYAVFHERMPSVAGLLRAAVSVGADSARDLVAEPLFRGRTDPRALRVQMRAARAWARLDYIRRLVANPELRSLVTRRDWL